MKILTIPENVQVMYQNTASVDILDLSFPVAFLGEIRDVPQCRLQKQMVVITTLAHSGPEKLKSPSKKTREIK